MANNNETLAAIIAEKLKEKGILRVDNTTFETELAQGKLKETNWKLALEEAINSTSEETTETHEENETE